MRQSTGEIIVVEEKEDYDKLLADCGDQLLVVDFYADWCGPCKMIGPKVAELAKQHMDVLFAKVNVDNASEISEACQISAMPTFQFYKNGKKLDEFKGASEEKLNQYIAKYK